MAGSSNSVLFVDVETTGLQNSDRVVSLGAIELNLKSLRGGHFDIRGTYLIFDPGKKSHPQAQAVHGYSDWVLRHQDPFEVYAGELHALFSSCKRVVAHNASFDQRFIGNEFRLAGAPLKRGDFFCTMQAFRSRIGGRAGLDSVMARIGVGARGKRHGAFEDAWRAMMVYLWLHDLPVPSLDIMPDEPPANWRDAPPEPIPLPRRSRRKGISTNTRDAPRPADPAEVNLSPDDLTPSHREVLIRALRPVAIVLIWIARATDSADEIVTPILRSAIESEADRHGIRRSAAFDEEIEEEFSGMQPTAEMLDIAARAIIREEAIRVRLTGWIRAIIRTGERTTVAERLAIARVKEAFGKAQSDHISHSVP